MITPDVVAAKDFKKGFRGYSESEVDIFLAELSVDYEAIFKENESLKEKLAMYKDQVSKYSSIEETLKETLITAQSAAEDTTNAANKKARIIVQEAELQARQIVDKANNRVVEIRNEYESLMKEFKVFRIKFKSLLEDELQNIDDIFRDVDAEKDFEKADISAQLEAGGTMRMQALEEVQDEEEKSMNLDIEEDFNEISEPDDNEVGSPEDIFNIK
ncbi:DivIVA domain-containing protein [Peptostreptococcus equinus]|uniref:DivIVA domain-containing protein n=1 Tax=Peptostreptococcus equinus TaxID=3003601 RepID=A0ABY7JT18_9FIRM|nr:DivIVA domain-containing protein [Peptostreptococcus sp. CBA3647]WAW15614.1 DivIVA domain-containing protein [Peptostreptococcus sp. CBA3647]